MTTNKYPGNCHRCGVRVPVAAGIALKIDGKWKVAHDGECSTTGPTAVQPARATIDIIPTPEQAECVRLFATGEDLVIQAGAGTGKTATLLLIAQYAKEHGKHGQYVAYNKSIVDDVATKVPGNVNASTMHSLAYRALGHQYRSRLNGPRIKADETASILGIDPWSFSVELPNTGGKREGRTLAAGFLAGKVMGAVRAFCATAEREVTVRHFAPVDGLDMPDAAGNKTYVNNDALAAYLFPFARKAWEDLITVTGRLRFSHDIYLKLWQLSGPTIEADFILLDEGQDADPVQVAIVEFQKVHDTQIVVVGDTYQVLYEWRGAVNALADFEEMGANVAQLTQSFRFGDSIAAIANNLLGRLNAPLRLRGYGPVSSTVGPIAEPSAILCRTNAGAVTVVLDALRMRRRPHLVGGGTEVVAFCKAAIELQTGRRTQYPELACFANWAEVQFYVGNDEQGDDLRLMVKLIDDFGAGVILDALERQPAEDQADVVVSTTHKSKGRQWPRVQVHSDFMPPRENEDDLVPAELRLAYVASTRAQFELDLTNVPHFVNPSHRPVMVRDAANLIATEMKLKALDEAY